MRTLFFSLLVLFATTAYGVDQDKMTKAMLGAITEMDSAKTVGEMQNAANKFERIANAEKKEWLPYYYAAFSSVLVGYMDAPEKLDAHLDKAQAFIDKAKKLTKKEAELHILQSWIYSARIGVDPMTRGAKYGGMSSAELAEAEKLDKDNPRIYYLRGSNMFYTPAQWGGGKDKAQPILEKAVEKYAAFKPKSEIHPNWGGDRAQKMLDECQAEH